MKKGSNRIIPSIVTTDVYRSIVIIILVGGLKLKAIIIEEKEFRSKKIR